MSKKEYKLGSCLDVQHGGNHYKDRGIQPIEFAQGNNLDWKQFNVIKYVTRHKDKKGAEDLKKAIHYLQMALEFDYGVRSAVEFDDGAEFDVFSEFQIGSGLIIPPSNVNLMDIPGFELQGSSIKYAKPVEAAPWYPDDSGEWVEYRGDCNPVEYTTLVEILMESERDDMDYGACVNEAGTYRWSLTGCNTDIVAYKVVKE